MRAGIGRRHAHSKIDAMEGLIAMLWPSSAYDRCGMSRRCAVRRNRSSVIGEEKSSVLLGRAFRHSLCSRSGEGDLKPGSAQTLSSAMA